MGKIALIVHHFTELDPFRMYINLDRFFFRFVTIHAFDRQIDGRTPFSRLDRPAFNATR